SISTATFLPYKPQNIEYQLLTNTRICISLRNVEIGNSITTIGAGAFLRCDLSEVTVPPSVEEIGASAFANNTNLKKIMMGHNMKRIQWNAFDGCPVDEVYITAQDPPIASEYSFSQYTGKLWVSNAEAMEAYKNDKACWYRFSSYAMIEPEEIKIEGAQTIDAAPGDTIRLTAKISPENVTLPQIFWRSTNPAVATVDNDGVVVVRGVEPELSTYAQGDADNTAGGCRIIAESLYADAPVAVVAINSELADIEDIVIDRPQSQTIDYTEPYDVYNMQGVWLGRSVDAVAPGFYIVRQGTKAAKILK
ncbi:MAG: leucine-rich repeat protein, partial [Paramuribaculum sp.]|nr:leucine-rich repeat protein [Paramuribaculum sp.]